MAIHKYTTEKLKKMNSSTNWELVAATKDEDISYDVDSPSFDTLLASGEVKVVRRGRPSLADPKEKVTLRLDAEVLRTLRATGKGWQTRISEKISEWALQSR
jgi:uncharacterized protein (DUF4415 family)